MRQVVQSVRGGVPRVIDTPRPQAGPTEVLVAPSHSVVSAGTERAVRALAEASVVAKARARPDLVRQVVRRARTDGIRSTVRAVQSRLDDDIALGYSAAGRVVTVGEAVRGLQPGDLVAAAGAGHAELQVVSGALAVRVPEGVAAEEAAFGAVASIALNGIRRADVGAGSHVAVVGLGLIGQLTARLLEASGCVVAGLDLRPWAVERATASGVSLARLDDGDGATEEIWAWTRGRGVDAVIVTAASEAPDPLRRAPALARDRAPIVLVGDVPIDVPRGPLYAKELDIRVARSYGPGRYDPAYEDLGIDYPVGYVPWTEGRNIEAFLDLLASGQVTVADLVTHRFPVDEAPAAYELLETAREPYLAIQLTYPESPPEPDRSPTVRTAAPGPSGTRDGPARVGVLGAGLHVRSTFVPALGASGIGDIVLTASAGGTSAARLAERVGATAVTPDELLAATDIDTVVIATPHDSHADLVVAALATGKDVFCEKPLALSDEELAAVRAAVEASTGHLGVGFNRRFSPAVDLVRGHLGDSGPPLVVTCRVAARPTDDTHWYADRRQGGRLLGEVCHFVDTAHALVGSPPASVWCTAADQGGEALLAEDLVVSMRHADGSLTTISYTTAGAPRTPKERVEVLGRGRTAVIDDFRAVELDGRRQRLRGQDKGHAAVLRAFREAARTGDPTLTDAALTTTAAMLAAAESLATGEAVRPA
jgi:predicted dehydrogenase/threonine dehydrogenase-like Zn-dependent dehydrogenase